MTTIEPPRMTPDQNKAVRAAMEKLEHARVILNSALRYGQYTRVADMADQVADQADILRDTVAPQLGEKLSDRAAMAEIFDILNGSEWHADHIEWVAEVVARTGRVIASPDDDGTAGVRA